MHTHTNQDRHEFGPFIDNLERGAGVCGMHSCGQLPVYEQPTCTDPQVLSDRCCPQ
jgi:hypothetical protein